MYMPNPHQAFVNWADNFATVLSAAPATYALMPADALAVAASVAALDATFALVGTRAIPGTDRSPANIAANDAQTRLTKALIRPFAVGISSNPGISDPDKVSIGVTVRSTSKVVQPPPTSQVIITPQMTVPGEVLIKIADENTPLLRARPYGTVGCELHTIAAAVAPAGASVIPYNCVMTRFRRILATDHGDVGKQLYMAARWLNRHGQPGPFGPVVSAVIG